MPLGIARSVLTTAPAGVATTAARAFFSDRSMSSTDVSTYQAEMTAGNRFANSNIISYVYWIRALDAEIGTNNYRLITYNIANGGGGCWITDNSGTNYGLGFNLYNGSLNIVVFSMKTGSTYGDTRSAFNTGFCDGNWHCVMVRCDYTNGAKRHLYLDGEDHSSNNTPGSAVDARTGTNTKLNDVRYVSLRVLAANDITGGYGNLNQDLPAADTGPIWFYDSDLDWTDATTRGYYYDASYTDGYVDGGTDGTAGGGSQPELYLYHSASTLVNGGSLSPTIATATAGTGTITILTTADGPGSGSTRT